MCQQQSERKTKGKDVQISGKRKFTSNGTGERKSMPRKVKERKNASSIPVTFGAF